MGFSTTQSQHQEREFFDVRGNANDRRVVEEFEREAGKYVGAAEEREGVKLYGWDLYCYDNGLVRLRQSGPVKILCLAIKNYGGGIDENQFERYRLDKMKWQGLMDLVAIREKANEIANEQIESIVANEA